MMQVMMLDIQGEGQTHLKEEERALYNPLLKINQPQKELISQIQKTQAMMMNLMRSLNALLKFQETLIHRLKWLENFLYLKRLL